MADPSANIIFGAVVDDRYSGKIHVTIIATGFSQSFQKTLLTDPKASRLLNRGVDLESKRLPAPFKSLANSPISVPPEHPRRMFFF